MSGREWTRSCTAREARRRPLGMAKRYAEAERLLKKAIEIKPGCADARYNLEVLYRKMGKQQDARK